MNSPYRGVEGKERVRFSEEIGPKVLGIAMDRYDRRKDSSLGKYLLSSLNNETAIEIEPIRIFAWYYSGRMKDAKIKK
jgi:hypothetical protein